MTLVLGAALAAGLLLVASPWLWRSGATGGAKHPPLASRLARLLADAGLARVRPRVIVAASVLVAVLAGAIAWLVIAVPAIAALAAVAAGSAPTFWLLRRRAALVRSRRALWPDVIDHLIASVRAGMSLPDAVSSLALTAPAVLRPAFAAFERDFAASGHFDSSAARLKAVLADPVADRIIETLRMAREVRGTELTTVLRSLGASVRAEAAIRGEVEARQSWVRNAAVLGVVAPWVVLGLLAMRPEGARAYSTPEGIALVIGGALISFVAYRLMLRIGRLPEPRRWFA